MNKRDRVALGLFGVYVAFMVVLVTVKTWMAWM